MRGEKEKKRSILRVIWSLGEEGVGFSKDAFLLRPEEKADGLAFDNHQAERDVSSYLLLPLHSETAEHERKNWLLCENDLRIRNMEKVK